MPLVERLTKNEIVSPTWQRLKGHAEQRLADLRMQNDGALSELETARLRGRIAELKSILALEQENYPALETTPDMVADSN
jgi:hypothetical protein